MHYYKSVNGGALMHRFGARSISKMLFAVIELLEFLNLIYRRYMVGYNPVKHGTRLIRPTTIVVSPSQTCILIAKRVMESKGIQNIILDFYFENIEAHSFLLFIGSVKIISWINKVFYLKRKKRR